MTHYADNLRDDGFRIVDSDGLLIIRHFYVDGMGRYVLHGALGVCAHSRQEMEAQIRGIVHSQNRPHIKWQAGYGWVEIDEPETT